MTTSPARLALLLSSASTLLCSCEPGPRLDEWGRPTLDASERLDPAGRGDALKGLPGLPLAVDASSTAVWEVERAWDEIDPASGIAWEADSGLTWDEKYRRWIDSLERADGSFAITTPYGKLPAPALEGAELAIFLRTSFASWHHLPYFVEARSGTERVFFGHFGIRTGTGRWRDTPNFKTSYQDFERVAADVDAGRLQWPSDGELRETSIAGQYDDAQPELGDGATAGTYFDRAFLNKRVGHFLVHELSALGSTHVADTANTWAVDPRAIATGDLLIERSQADAIGRTVVVKERRSLGERTFGDQAMPQLDIEVVAGGMPRAQPRWQDSAATLEYATADTFGGKAFAQLGGGLSRWRSARQIDGMWTNAVPGAEADAFIARTGDAESVARIGRRTEELGQIIVSLSPTARIDALATAVSAERQKLRANPASCDARSRREQAFASMYEIGAEVGMTRMDLDRQYRLVEDYVLAELVAGQSKTCCWSSATPVMFEIVMDRARQDLAAGACTVPVFMSRADAGDGYQQYREFATATGRAVQWTEWTDDEACPQAGVREDAAATSRATALCQIASDVIARE